jgi:hypothetical protein
MLSSSDAFVMILNVSSSVIENGAPSVKPMIGFAQLVLDKVPPGESIVHGLESVRPSPAPSGAVCRTSLESTQLSMLYLSPATLAANVADPPLPKNEAPAEGSVKPSCEIKIVSVDGLEIVRLIIRLLVSISAITGVPGLFVETELTATL